MRNEGWTLEDDRDVAQWTAREEIPKILASLDEGTPVVLALIRVRKGNPTGNHQVLAVDYELDEDTKKLDLTLYDPNHPGKEPIISVDLSDPDNGIHPRQSTGEPLRGFFVIRYKKEMPPVFEV